MKIINLEQFKTIPTNSVYYLSNRTDCSLLIKISDEESKFLCPNIVDSEDFDGEYSLLKEYTTEFVIIKNDFKSSQSFCVFSENEVKQITKELSKTYT